jgi:hypothetical protein
MDELTASLVEHGVPLVGLNVFLQQLGLPIPAVPTMIVAGAMAAASRLSGLGVFVISVAASVIADLLWYWAGRRYGYRVLKPGRRLAVAGYVRQTEGIFGATASSPSSCRSSSRSTVAPRSRARSTSLRPSVAGLRAWRCGRRCHGRRLRLQHAGRVAARPMDNAAFAATLVDALLAAYIVYRRAALARFVAASRITVDGSRRSSTRAALPRHRRRQQARARPPAQRRLLDLDEIDARQTSSCDATSCCCVPERESARRRADPASRGFKRALRSPDPDRIGARGQSTGADGRDRTAVRSRLSSGRRCSEVRQTGSDERRDARTNQFGGARLGVAVSRARREGARAARTAPSGSAHLVACVGVENACSIARRGSTRRCDSRPAGRS